MHRVFSELIDCYDVPLQVVRDKRTGKTKGYGFVSFKDPNDYVRAMREMNGERNPTSLKAFLSYSLEHISHKVLRATGPSQPQASHFVSNMLYD